MRNLVIGLAGVLAALLLAGTAVAGTTYAGPKQWWPSEGAGSAYSSGWHYNYFFKENGLDATVTFIDNVSYSWHGTVRGTSVDDLRALVRLECQARTLLFSFGLSVGKLLCHGLTGAVARSSSRLSLLLRPSSRRG